MKKIILALTLLLLLASCGADGESQQPPDPLQEQTDSELQIIDEQEPDSSTPEPEHEGQINSALNYIPGGQRLRQAEKGLFLIKEYGREMKWMEVNQLEHVERGTALSTNETYFLLLPRYVGAWVEVVRMDLDESGNLSPGETLYTNQDTPDSYGLVLTRDDANEGRIRVTVEYMGESCEYLFSYDNEEERPELQIFPEGSASEEDSEAPVTYKVL